MRADQARTIPIDQYLAKQGIKPQNTRMSGRELWYCSPIRKGDDTPSFKVDVIINKWYDHGLARGGNTLDLAMEICGCSVRDALKHLEKTKLYSAAGYSSQHYASTSLPSLSGEKMKLAYEKEKQSKPLKLVASRLLTHPALLQYLGKRKINTDIARQYVSEIDFKPPESASSYFGIGYPAGDGFEARNTLFKGFVGSQKNISFHECNNSPKLLVFEGFIDFLTYLTVKDQKTLLANVLVLNSGNLKTKALPVIQDSKYTEIELFLDNDEMGNICTAYFFENASREIISDMRIHYKKYNDLNEWHTERTI